MSESIPVDEIRDYARINALVAEALDRGATLVRLTEVGRQRMLLGRLRGAWSARVEVEGPPGPECASEMDAPGLVVSIRGDAADGLGRGLVAGTIHVFGACGDAAGYELAGGTIAIRDLAGHRLGLGMQEGMIIARSGTGRLAAERQEGGVLLAASFGPNPGRGAIGGRHALPADFSESERQQWEQSGRDLGAAP